MGNRGHGHQANKLIPRHTKARSAADIQRIHETEMLRLQGDSKLRAALRPGGLVRLTRDASVTDKMGVFDKLEDTIRLPAEQQQTLKKGAILMMINIERVEVNGLSTRIYTFLKMGSVQRCTVPDLSLIEAVQ